MKKYDNYKDSGIEWIGEIPEHWSITKIKNVSELFGRIGFRGYTVGDIVEKGQGAISLSPSNIFEQKLKLKKGTYISWEKYNESPEIQIYNNDVILVKTASVGKVSFIENLSEPATLNPQLVVFKNVKLENKYLYYLLISQVIQTQIKSDLVGGVIPTLSQSIIKNYYIPLNTIEEQIQIANYLDHKTNQVDSLIVKKEQLISLLQEERIVVINQTVTRGLDPKVKMKHSGIEWLGEIPEHWEVPKLKFVCEFILDGTHGSHPRVEVGYRLLSVRNIINGKFVFREDDSCVSVEEYNSISKKFKINKDDIQLAIVGATLGKVALVDEMSEDFVTQRSLATIRSINSICIPSYLHNFMKSSTFQSYLWLNTGFSAQPGVYLGTLQNCAIPLPSISEQIEIVSSINEINNRIDDIISKSQQEIELLKEYKTVLISEVVTGKVDVRNENLN